MGLPDIEGFRVVGCSMFKLCVVLGKLEQSFTLACGPTHLGRVFVVSVHDYMNMHMSEQACVCLALGLPSEYHEV